MYAAVVCWLSFVFYTRAVRITLFACLTLAQQGPEKLSHSLCPPRPSHPDSHVWRGSLRKALASSLSDAVAS